MKLRRLAFKDFGGNSKIAGTEQCRLCVNLSEGNRRTLG